MKQISHFGKLASAIFLTGLLVFSSCKKDNNANPANPDPALSVDAVQSDANASAQFEDVFNIAMSVQSSDAGEDIGLGTGAGIMSRDANATIVDSSSRCYTVSVVPKIAHQFPKTVTIDFGNGCVGKDGKTRSGKIITIFTGPMIIPGSKASTTFENYKVDSFAIEGTHVIENTSSSNKFSWSVNIINGKITNMQSGKWIAWNAVRDHKQIKGNGTPFYSLDNVFEITGHSEGNNSKGISWTEEITQPLIRKFTCQWRVQGQITYHRNDNTAVLDYGNGNCDNKATVTVNGKTYEITLP